MTYGTQVHVCAISEPGRTDELEALLDDATIRADDIVGIVGKIDGSGGFNDAGRELTASRVRGAIRSRLRQPSNEVVDDIPVILSSGCAGIISPHLTIFSRAAVPMTMPAGLSSRLVVGHAVSDPIEPPEIGRLAQVDKVAAAVRSAWADADRPESVECVLIKSPAVSQRHQRAYPTGRLRPNLNEAMVYSIDAAALGVAVALGEVDSLSEADIRQDWTKYSSVAIVSAGPEIERAEVVLLGNSAKSWSSYRVGHSAICDPLDRTGIIEAIANAFGESAEIDMGRVTQVFAKLILPVDDMVRGHPTSFFQEPSPAAFAKAVGATLVGTTIGHTRIYVSGGERGSHQGPPGAGPVAAIVDVGEVER